MKIDIFKDNFVENIYTEQKLAKSYMVWSWW